MLSKEYKNTRELLEALMEGGEAIKREKPRGNETSYFFMVPKAQSPTGEEVINVPDGVDPQAFKAAGYKVPETATFSMGNNQLSTKSNPGSGLSSNAESGSYTPFNASVPLNTSNTSSNAVNTGLNNLMGLKGLDNPYNTQDVLNGGISSSTGVTPGLATTGTEANKVDWLNQVKLTTEQKLNQDALSQNASSPNTGVDSLTPNTGVGSNNQRNREKVFPEIRSIPDNSKYSVDNLDTFLADMKTGKYRTYASDMPAGWGNDSAKSIEEGIENGNFSQEPANVFPFQTGIKKIFPVLNKPEYQFIPIALDYIQSPNRYMWARLIAPFADFYKALEIRKSGIIGGDKVAHCTASYNATNRGKYGKKVAYMLGEYKEKKDAREKGLDIQDASDDWAADERGIEGALKGLPIKEACPIHPIKYFK